MKKGSLVLWKINPVFIGVVLGEREGTFSRKYEIYWFQEKRKIINFEQDLILLSD